MNGSTERRVCSKDRPYFKKEEGKALPKKPLEKKGPPQCFHCSGPHLLFRCPTATPEQKDAARKRHPSSSGRFTKRKINRLEKESGSKMALTPKGMKKQMVKKEDKSSKVI